MLTFCRLGTVAATSLALAMAGCVMWVGNYDWARASVGYTRRTSTYSNRWFVHLYSARGGVQSVFAWDGAGGSPGFTFEPLYTYPEHSDCVRLTVAGFVVAYLPQERSGGDWFEAPFVALVIPYWFVVAATAVLPLRRLSLHRRRRHRPGGFAVVGKSRVLTSQVP